MPEFNGCMADVPAKAFRFEFAGNMFSKIDAEKRQVELTLYDGGVSPHWFWGNLAFDLGGMELAKEKIAILYGHDPNTRLGFSTAADFDGAFTLRGELLDNEQARAVLSDAKGGFPFEASLRFNSDTFKVRRVKDGETVQVNGNELKGPGSVIESCVILEGSICVIGALQNTDARFKLQAGDGDAGVDEFKRQYPSLHDKVFSMGKAGGEKAAADMFAAISAVCPDAELAVECFTGGKTAIEAATAYGEKIGKEVADLKSKLAAASDPDAAATAEFLASDRSDAYDDETDGESTAELSDDEKKVARKATAKFNQAMKEGRINMVGGASSTTQKSKKTFWKK